MNKDSAPRRISFRASASPPPSNPPACRIFLRRGNNAKFPAAALPQSVRWLACDPAKLRGTHRRSAPSAVASSRYPAEQASAALPWAELEKRQVSAALQPQERRVQPEFRAAPSLSWQQEASPQRVQWAQQ